MSESQSPDAISDFTQALSHTILYDIFPFDTANIYPSDISCVCGHACTVLLHLGHRTPYSSYLTLYAILRSIGMFHSMYFPECEIPPHTHLSTLSHFHLRKLPRLSDSHTTEWEDRGMRMSLVTSPLQSTLSTVLVPPSSSVRSGTPAVVDPP